MVMQLPEKRLKPTEIALCLSCYRLATQRRRRTCWIWPRLATGHASSSELPAGVPLAASRTI
jgi:hypothetical protein